MEALPGGKCSRAPGMDDTKGVTSSVKCFMVPEEEVKFHGFDLSSYASNDLSVVTIRLSDPSVRLHEITDDQMTIQFSSLGANCIDYVRGTISVTLSGSDMFPSRDANNVTTVVNGYLTLSIGCIFTIIGGHHRLHALLQLTSQLKFKGAFKQTGTRCIRQRDESIVAPAEEMKMSNIAN